jgi:hypothetical protein
MIKSVHSTALNCATIVPDRFFTDVEAQFAPFGEAFIPYGLKPPESAKGIVGASRKKVGHR